MRKDFEVIGSKGDLYNVYFSDESGAPKAGCTCRAGEQGQLCKHVLEIINDDDDVYNMLANDGILDIYQEYLDLLDQSEAIKKKAIALKKKFARVLLQN